MDHFTLHKNRARPPQTQFFQFLTMQFFNNVSKNCKTLCKRCISRCPSHTPTSLKQRKSRMVTMSFNQNPLRKINGREYIRKDWAGCSQDHLVCFNLLTILTCQGHISKVIVISQPTKSRKDIPLQTKFLRHFSI